MGREVSGQQAAGQRHAGDQADAAFVGLSEKQFRWPQPKGIEDDLHRLHLAVLDRLERFLHFFNAHAVVANLSRCHESVETEKNLWPVVNLSGWTMELEKIESFGFKIAQAAIDEAVESIGIVAVGRVWIEPSPRLCGHVKRLAAFAAQAGNEAFTQTVAVDVGGVKKIDA